MTENAYTYIIVGAALTGASAVEGLRERDATGSILLIGSEPHLPYNRPPLSKKLWFGKTTEEKIFVHPEAYYTERNVTLLRGVTVVALDAEGHLVIDDQGRHFRYEKLLLATGGIPRTLDIPGGALSGVTYYRYLDDYRHVRAAAGAGKSAVVIGGGFIGSEMAAALTLNEVAVTMIFPHEYLGARIFPDDLGRAVTRYYRERGVEILANDAPTAIEMRGERYLTTTKSGRQVESDLIIAGVGITPSIMLANMAGLEIDNGIVVNALLQTSDPAIFAAGDNALFPYQALGKPARVEHWDNAKAQGRHAGRNGTGTNEIYTYMPYFFSDLFEFGYEAVGDVDSRLETFADWQHEHDTGVIYYLREGKVRGVMLCNVWEKLDAARALIRADAPVTPEALRGAIR